MTHQRPAALTLVTVFLTGAVALIILMADNIRAMELHTRVHAQAVSEQAFYASESCLEEAYLQLRTDVTYTGVAALPIGDSTCTATVHHDAQPSNGSVTSTGQNQKSQRSTVSNFTAAGPTTVGTPFEIVMLFDRSRSMESFRTCDVFHEPAFTQSECAQNGGRWVKDPLFTAKFAASAFINNFATAEETNRLGFDAFASDINPKIDPVAPSQNALLQNAVDTLTTQSGTHIGLGLETATAQLDHPTATNKFIILFTDGHPDVGCRDVCAKANADIAKAKGIKIFSVGLILSTDPADIASERSILQYIASTPAAANEQYYYETTNPRELESIYDKIFASIIAYNIGQGSWNEK